MPRKRDQQRHLPFPPPTPKTPLPSEVVSRCRDLVSQMLCKIMIRELHPEEINVEREDSADAPRA
jgi:hypothetical protein